MHDSGALSLSSRGRRGIWGLATWHVRQRYLSGGIEGGVSFGVGGCPVGEGRAGGGGERERRERTCERRPGEIDQ